jgi:hypothetical protein
LAEREHAAHVCNGQSDIQYGIDACHRCDDAVVIGGIGAGLGIFTPAYEFYVPAVLGLAAIVLAIVGFTARGRAWTAMALGALALLEAVYGVAQVSKAEHALDAISNGPATFAGSQSQGSQIVREKFGTSYTGSTLSIGLSKPTAYSPSDSAMIQQQTGRAVAFNITVADNTKDQPLPAMELTIQAQSGSTLDQEIEDSANNVGSSLATILPGKSLSWEIAYSVPKGATDITVQVSAMGPGKTIVFSGPL